MAKLPRTGVGYQCLDEREVTLREVVASLGLKPLSTKEEREIRRRLGFGLAKWDAPYAAPQVKDIVSSLNAHARRLEQLAPLGIITREGVARVHDIAVSGQLVQTLASDPEIGSVEAAHEYLSKFCDTATVMALACRATARSLQSHKGNGGRSRYKWYDEFTAVLLDVCKKNKIVPTVGIDSVSDEPLGTLPRIVSAFERLMPFDMRSGKPAAMVKRLQRSLVRLARQDVPAASQSTIRKRERPQKSSSPRR